MYPSEVIEKIEIKLVNIYSINKYVFSVFCVHVFL